MYCPKCGTLNQDTTMICSNCELDFSKITKISSTTSITDSNQENISNHSQKNTPFIMSDTSQTIDNVIPNTKIQNMDIKTDSGNFINFKKIVSIFIALAIFIMFFVAANNISNAGNEIMQIQSIGGETLEEAYYCELGSIYAGYAMIIRAMGIFFSTILIWLGFKK